MSSSDASIWLTGSGGFIGRHLTPLLERRGRLKRWTPDASGADGASRCWLDMNNRSAVRQAIQSEGPPDVFIHLGWGAMEDPGHPDHLAGNITRAQILIDELFAAGSTRFVFIGSTNEYGARAGELFEDMPPEGFMTNYAKGKWAVTQYGLAQAALHRREFISVRVFNTYGALQRSGSLLNKLYRCYNEGRKPDLGPCENYRDYIHAQDVAEGITRLCEARIERPVIVNLGGGQAIQLKDFVKTFWSKLGGRPEDILFGAHEMRAGEPAQFFSFASLARLEQLTHWRPELSLEKGIELTIQMMRQTQAM